MHAGCKTVPATDSDNTGTACVPTSGPSRVASTISSETLAECNAAGLAAGSYSEAYAPGSTCLKDYVTLWEEMGCVDCEPDIIAYLERTDRYCTSMQTETDCVAASAPCGELETGGHLLRAAVL